MVINIVVVTLLLSVGSAFRVVSFTTRNAPIVTALHRHASRFRNTHLRSVPFSANATFSPTEGIMSLPRQAVDVMRSYGLGDVSSYPFLQIPTQVNASSVFSHILRSASAAQSSSDTDTDCLTARIERLESSVASLSSLIRSKRQTRWDPLVSQRGKEVVDALARGQLPMTPKTVELGAIGAFFCLGAVLGRSLLDRLWLMGGLTSAVWAAGAVRRDTRGGAYARAIGARAVQLVRDLQEKYNQVYVFYKTGKLAYVSSKTWEKYDKQYAITQKLNLLKKEAIQRASEFNSTFGVQKRRIDEEFARAWRVLRQPTPNVDDPAHVKQLRVFRAELLGALQKGVHLSSGAVGKVRRATTEGVRRVASTVARLQSGANIAPQTHSAPSSGETHHDSEVRSWRQKVQGRLRRTTHALNNALLGRPSDPRPQPAVAAVNVRGNLINPWSLPKLGSTKAAAPAQATLSSISSNGGAVAVGADVSAAGRRDDSIVKVLLATLIVVEVAKLIILRR